MYGWKRRVRPRKWRGERDSLFCQSKVVWVFGVSAGVISAELKGSLRAPLFASITRRGNHIDASCIVKIDREVPEARRATLFLLPFLPTYRFFPARQHISKPIGCTRAANFSRSDHRIRRTARVLPVFYSQHFGEYDLRPLNGAIIVFEVILYNQLATVLAKIWTFDCPVSRELKQNFWTHGCFGWAGGPAFDFDPADSFRTKGAPSLRFLQGWE